jgi:hypothetical protein
MLFEHGISRRFGPRSNAIGTLESQMQRQVLELKACENVRKLLELLSSIGCPWICEADAPAACPTAKGSTGLLKQ